MRRKPTVAFDIDGVLADFTLGFTTAAAELGLVKEPWTGWEQPNWKFDFHVDPVWEAIDNSGRFWADLDTLTTKQEREMMNRMSKDVNIVYVTARKGAEGQTKHWLSKWGFPDGPLFFTEDKVPLYKSLGSGLRWAIDDKPATLEAMQAAGIPTIIRAWPYNDHVLGTRVVRVGTLMRAWSADE